MQASRRVAEAGLSALEDIEMMFRRGFTTTALEARIARMNAEAGRVLVEDVESLILANTLWLLERSDLPED